MSDPVLLALDKYRELLRSRPILTKSVTSSAISGLGSVISQVLSGKEISPRALSSFILFGGVATGPVCHFFYLYLDKVVPPGGPVRLALRIILDRVGFSPLFLFVSLYILGRLQGGGHHKVSQGIGQNYLPCLLANWKIWTIPQLINIGYVPAHYRVLFANMVALVWNVYLAKKAT